jgi:hypothetical protein
VRDLVKYAGCCTLQSQRALDDFDRARHSDAETARLSRADLRG